jgi:DNA invertase Pin-like site-specific DNA recombinase
MPRHRRALGYARVSSAEQALGSSLGDQQASIKAHAKAGGVVVSQMYVEAESAIHEKFERREQMQALLADVRAGDLVLCDKLDRWSRDPEFTYRSVREILAKGASFYAISDRCDPSTSEGDTALGFRILFAREEHKRIRERLVGTRNLLRARGFYVEGVPPYGYKRTHPPGTKGADKNILIPVEPAASHVRRMFRMVIAGKSLQDICDALELGKKRVWSSLHCRYYLGEIDTDAGWIPAKHKPIIDAATFSEANEILRNRRHGGPRPRSAPARTDGWLLRDVARCARCGGPITSAWAKERDYYRCFRACRTKGNRATNGSYMPVPAMDAAFTPLVLARLAELREEIARGDEPSAPQVVDFGAKREKLEAKRARYLEQHSDGLITIATLRSSLAKVDAELLKIAAAEASRPKRMTAPQRRQILQELAILERAWAKASPKERRQLVNVLAERVDIASGQEPKATWRAKEAISKAVEQ